MRNTVNIMVVEDNELYNRIVSSKLVEKTKELKQKWEFSYELFTFTDAGRCINKIKSPSFESNDSIAFIDYYLGNGLNGFHIIKVLKELIPNLTIVLLSNSRNARYRVNANYYDYFILKDDSALSLCGLCLEQFIANKFFVPLST